MSRIAARPGVHDLKRASFITFFTKSKHATVEGRLCWDWLDEPVSQWVSSSVCLAVWVWSRSTFPDPIQKLSSASLPLHAGWLPSEVLEV